MAKNTVRDKDLILKTWLGMNKFLKTASEEQVLTLLKYEQANSNRRSVLTRLYGRYNLLRSDRELREILGA